MNKFLLGALFMVNTQFATEVIKKVEPVETLYKILTLSEWEKSKQQGFLVKPDYDKKFVHFSTREQVEAVINKKFKDKEYVLLTIDTKKINIGYWTLEFDSKKTDKYYHLYEGETPVSAIVEFKENRK